MKTITVALDKLDADTKNARNTYREECLKELAQQIRATGYRVLQNLVVQKSDTKGRYLVTAGERRRRALMILAQAGEINAAEYMVECGVIDAEEATEISLIENIARENMHPCDQYLAFKAMADAGKPIGDIAAKFNVSELIVKKRLALASVSPALIELYRNDTMSLAQLQTFAVCADHARQEQVWASLPEHGRSAQSIKKALHSVVVPLRSALMMFVTVADYSAAGGSIVCDLFDQDGGFATDPDLLAKLAMERLELLAEPVRAEGWKWVSCHAEAPSDFYHLRRVYPETVSRELSTAELAELQSLATEYDELAGLIENDEDQLAEDRIAEIQDRQKELEDTLELYTEEQKARAGVVVYVTFEGKVTIIRGVISAEDTKAEKLSEKSGAANSNEALHSAALLQELTAQKTAVIRAEFANNPNVALVAVVHAMLLNALFTYQTEHSCLEIRLSSERLENHIKDTTTSKAMQTLFEIAHETVHLVPSNPAELWNWCMERDQNQLLKLMAFAASTTINVVQFAGGGRSTQTAHADNMANALKIDMKTWFEPTADNYFGRLNKTGIEKALTEAKSADLAAGISQMKKGEAAAYAANHIKNTGWLPHPMRINSSDNVDQTFPEAAE